MSKLQEEVDKAYEDLDLAKEECEILYNDAIRLPYLCAVVKQSMRLHPSIQHQLPRFTPENGIQLGEILPARGFPRWNKSSIHESFRGNLR